MPGFLSVMYPPQHPKWSNIFHRVVQVNTAAMKQQSQNVQSDYYYN